MAKQNWRLDVSKVKSIDDIKKIFHVMELNVCFDRENPKSKYYKLRDLFTIPYEPNASIDDEEHDHPHPHSH
jgi:hypothetical protein